MEHSKKMPDFTQLYETPEWLDLHFDAKYTHRMSSAAMYDIRLGEKVADIGCGTGVWIDFFLKKLGGNGFIIGLDPNPKNIKAAKARLQEINIKNAEFIQGDLAEFLNSAEKYDVIHFGNSIGYIKNKSYIFERLSRKLTPGGRIIIRQHDESTLLMAPIRQTLLQSFKLQLAKSQENPLLKLPFDLYAGMNIQFDLISSEKYIIDMRVIPFEARAPFDKNIQQYIIETCKWIMEMTNKTSTDTERQEWQKDVISRICANREFYFYEIEYLYHAYLLS